MADRTPRTPAGLSPRAAKFWRDARKAFDFEQSDAELLTQVCRVMTNVDALDDAIAEHGTVTEGSRGQLVTNPAIGEVRQQRLALARLLGQLGLPDPEEPDTPQVPTTRQAASRTANQFRWQGHTRRGA
jgi:phage terminase small subunit